MAFTETLEGAEVDIEDVIDLDPRKDLLLERVDQQPHAALRISRR